MATCREIPLSEEYADFIVNFAGSDEKVLETFGGECFRVFDT